MMPLIWWGMASIAGVVTKVSNVAKVSPETMAIVSGLTFATLLTLVTTPAMLAIPHQIKGIMRRLRGMRGSAADQLAGDSAG